jgi:hypothetical protein
VNTNGKVRRTAYITHVHRSYIARYNGQNMSMYPCSAPCEVMTNIKLPTTEADEENREGQGGTVYEFAVRATEPEANGTHGLKAEKICGCTSIQ